MGNRFSTILNPNPNISSYPASDTPADRRPFAVTSCRENCDQVSRWCMQYTLGTKCTCAFELRETRIKNRLESVSVLFSDSVSNNNNDSTGNFAHCVVKIERARGGGLRGGFEVKIFSGGTNQLQFCSTRTFRGCIIETQIFFYGCSFREGLVVLEKKKKLLLNSNTEDFYEMTLVHYFVTDEVGVSALAKIHCDKGDDFVVEVEHPVDHPSSDLRMVLVETCRNRVWMPTACSHCARAQNNHLISRSRHLKEFFNNRHIIIACKIVAGNHYLTSLVNNAGNVHGSDNGSLNIHINKASVSPPQEVKRLREPYYT